MTLIYAFDSETYLIRPGRQAPRVVCVQSKDPRDGVARIELTEPGLDRLESALADPRIRFVGHNVAFDMACAIATRPRLLRPIFAAYKADRVTCTKEREKLVRIAEGSLSKFKTHGLIDLVDRYGLEHNFHAGDKGEPDSWRMRYSELDGIPIAQWPEDARRYALADLVVGDVYRAQEAKFPAAWLDDQFRQARAAFVWTLTSARGMMTDLASVKELAKIVEVEHEIVRRVLTVGDAASLEKWCEVWNDAHPDAVKAGKEMTPQWLRVPYSGGLVRPDGTKDTKAAAQRMRAVRELRGLGPRLTKTGTKKVKTQEMTQEEAFPLYTSLDVDACEETADPILIAYARYGSIDTLRSRVERLRLAAESGLPIQPRYDNLKETGRTSCSKGDSEPGKPLSAFGDQVQNLPRSPGLRECYRARPGCVILSCDWAAAELHTLAQTCLDYGLDSNMARVLNSGQDIHLWYACQVNGWDYADAKARLKSGDKSVKAARQGGKACNFGFPGGLGIEKFIAYAFKTYQVVYDVQEATCQRGLWRAAFPEMAPYFAIITRIVDSGAPLRHFGSNRYRGDLRFTSAANSTFQGRCADMAKWTGWRLTEMEYLEGLLASPWAFAHDEFLVEIPEEVAHEVALEVKGVMEEAGRVWCPGAPVRAEPALQYVWRKGAEPVYRDGRLIPWEDRDLKPEIIEGVQKDLACGRSMLQTSWRHGLTVEKIKELAA